MIIQTQHNVENPEEFTNNHFETAGKFSQVVGYKVDVQKSVVFLCIINKQIENKDPSRLSAGTYIHVCVQADRLTLKSEWKCEDLSMTRTIWRGK